MLKRCNKCGVEKDKKEFTRRLNRKSGIYSTCNKCKNEYRAKKYLQDKENDPIKLWIKNNVNGVRWRAKNNNIDFDICKDDVKILLEKQNCKCIYCHKDFNFNGNSIDKFLSPTFDRILPKQGYLKSNVVICCYRCNAIKNNASYEELKQITDNLEKVLKGMI